MFLYLNFPSWIHPQIFPNIPFLSILRWYGLMYVFAFATAYYFLNKKAKEGLLDAENYKCKEDDLFSFIATGIIFLLIGSRVLSTLVYDTSGIYLKKPWLIFFLLFTSASKYAVDFFVKLYRKLPQWLIKKIFNEFK